MNQPLSELGAELTQLLELLDSDDPDDVVAADAILDDLLPQIGSKIDGYAGAIAHYERVAGNIDVEVDRLKVRKAKQLNNADKLKQRLMGFLESREAELGAKGKKIEGVLYRVSLVNNGGKLPLAVDPVASFEFVDPDLVTKTTIEVLDKDKTRAYLSERGLTTLIDSQGMPIAHIQPRGKHLKIT